MQEIQLWKQYAETLVRQNQAKNFERETLAKQITHMEKENYNISKQCTAKDNKLKEQQQYIAALQSKIRGADRAVYEINNEKQNMRQLLDQAIFEREELEQELISFRAYARELQIRNQSQKMFEKHEFEVSNLQSSVFQKNNYQNKSDQIHEIKQSISRLEASSVFSEQRNNDIIFKNRELQSRVAQLQAIIGMRESNLKIELEKSKRSYTTQIQTNADKKNKSSCKKTIVMHHKNLNQSFENQNNKKYMKKLNTERTAETPMKLLKMSNKSRQIKVSQLGTNYKIGKMRRLTGNNSLKIEGPYNY